MTIAKVISFLIVCCTILTGFINRQNTASKIAYPEGYRQWTHIKSGIVGPESPAAPKYEGFTHIYANAKALERYRTGIFPDGAIIVFDVIDIVGTKAGINEGERKFIDVMVRDKTLYADTGGWGYEEFDRNNKTSGILSDAAKAKCFQCHASRKNNDYVFSVYRQ